MLVIHPIDETTDFLKLLYDPDEVTVINQSTCNTDVKSLLNHVPRQERIMLLGHGSENGLFSRGDSDFPDFDRLMISHQHSYYLRRHGGNIVGIWCNADAFARKEGLHGLFSGMIISDIDEAKEYGFDTSEEELEKENLKLAFHLGFHLCKGTPLHLIPEIMCHSDNIHNPLTRFNYNNFYYL